MKIFWSIHFSRLVQQNEGLIKLMDFIDSDRESILVVNQSEDNPLISGFTDPGHVNVDGLPNRVVLETDDWAFPYLSEINYVEEHLKRHYDSSLLDAKHYLFGQATQDCVARMGSTLVYGSGRSYFAHPTCERIATQNFPDYGNPLTSLDNLHFIEELCHPNKEVCIESDFFPADYCDHVRIYDREGILHSKELIGIDSIIQS
jgi:hypothetical protein